MEKSPTTEQIESYISLFRGREDVFAVRWEKGGKAGYMPAYNVDWNLNKIHKDEGGSFKNFTGKTFQPLTYQELLKHFRGDHFIGIYPLLPDNTSWFIAADFDEES